MLHRAIRCLATVLLVVCLFGEASATPPIEAYGRLPGVDLMRLSPSGERYAFIALVGEKRRLAVVTVGGKVLVGINVGTAKVRDLDWAGDDHVLVTVSETVDQRLDFENLHEELESILNIDLLKNQVWEVFSHAPNVAKPVFGYFGSRRLNGHQYGYFGGLTYIYSKAGGATPGTTGYAFDRDVRDLYRVDLDSGETKRIALDTSTHNHWVLSPDGAILAHSEYTQHTGDWHLYRGEGRDNALVQETNSPLRQIGLAGQGRSPGTVLVVDDTGVADRLTELSIKDGQHEELLEHNDVEEYLHDPDTGLFVGAIVKEEPRAIFFDKKLQARINGMRKAFSGLEVHLVSFSRNLDRMIVKTDGANDSGTLWLVDIASGHADPIGYERPEIRREDVGSTNLVQYSAADGLELEGVLTLPPNRKPENLPLIMMPHGGPIGVADQIGFDWWAQAYASAGYAVFQPNYRGSGTYGKKFRDAGYGQWGRKMQTDLSDGVAALAARGLIDPKRVCIVGGSYGGYAALAGVAMQDGIYRCAVAVAGPSDMSSFFEWQLGKHGYRYANSHTRYWLAVTGADKDSSVMRNISPINFVSHVHVPILLIHGKEDTVVPIEQSEEMSKALKSAGKPVEFVVMDGEDHWLSREETRLKMLKASVAFVMRHNPPESSPATSVAAK